MAACPERGVTCSHRRTCAAQIMQHEKAQDRNLYGPYFCLLEPKYLAVIAINCAHLTHTCFGFWTTQFSLRWTAAQCLSSPLRQLRLCPRFRR